MVLLAVVDSKYNFLMADFATNEHISDDGVIETTKFYVKLVSGELNIPRRRLIGNRELNYVFVGDEAFPLRTDFM